MNKTITIGVLLSIAVFVVTYFIASNITETVLGIVIGSTMLFYLIVDYYGV